MTTDCVSHSGAFAAAFYPPHQAGNARLKITQQRRVFLAVGDDAQRQLARTQVFRTVAFNVVDPDIQLERVGLHNLIILRSGAGREQECERT
uniref:Uncharacterized protein n=1 Tax=Raoultella ornithinolytica TaxID=54291 RepID=A0A0M4KKB7_RAOOR|nr:hypothetical protein [Raoultella ornithinolytica]